MYLLSAIFRAISSAKMFSVALTKKELAQKQYILEKKRQIDLVGVSGELNIFPQHQEGSGSRNNSRTRHSPFHLNQSEKMMKNRILSSKLQNHDRYASNSLEGDIIVEKVVKVVDLATDEDEVQIIEEDNAGTAEDRGEPSTGSYEVTKNSIEVEENNCIVLNEQEAVVVREIQTTKHSLKECRVSLKRVSIERTKPPALKEGAVEELTRKLKECAQEIKECEEKEMDWSEGARSSYMKVGRLKKKFTRLHNALKAQDSSPVNEADHLESVSLFLQEEDEDPAESNPTLKAKLDKQLRENRSKLDK